MKIIRSKRQTLALQIAKDATVVVRAPERVPAYFIEKFVARCGPWIEEKQRIAREALLNSPPLEFKEGAPFLYLGERYPLTVSADITAPPVLFDGRQFQVRRECLEDAPAYFKEWYKRHALEILTERVEFFAGATGLKYSEIRIASAKTRWGSCSSSGKLSFTWRLIMAPMEAVDYVVVHELVHTAELNHSKRFWSKVENILPGYEKAKDWLRRHERLLEL